MADPFNVGDVVRLKSGGEGMTVRGVTCDMVRVSWWKDSRLEERQFPAAMLMLMPSVAASEIKTFGGEDVDHECG